MTKKHSLVIYYSLSGNTKKAAEYIQKKTDSDIEELRPIDPYAGYDDAASRGEDEKDNDIHPKIQDLQSDLSQYDDIYLGFPTWWNQPPMLIHTFLAQNDLDGKTIIPFSTSMSSSIDGSQTVIEESLAGKNVNIKPGFMANRDSNIENYLKNNN